MILRKLEVYGFKSFSDRQTFTFAPGITAVIGPNGCGKSNVVDAFKWILGEQAPSSLRSKGMTDVLHLDRDGREAVPYAEGTISFDNSGGVLQSDAVEVEVTRRIHRDGRSEYLMNGRPVRLRDLRDLFMGTGIGTRSYFVLEQGRITEIIKKSPVERRAIFEEAAGIGKYNKRRREAERKLQAVDDNLSRARDVIAEVQRQIRSLRIQAGKARSFQEGAERLREVRLQAGTIRFYRTERDLGEIATRLASIGDDEERALAVYARATRVREESQMLRERVDQAVRRYDAALEADAERVAEWREEIEAQRGRASHFEAQADAKLAERDRLAGEFESRRAEVARVDDELQTVAAARGAFVELRWDKSTELDEAVDAVAEIDAQAVALRARAEAREQSRVAFANRLGEHRVRRGNAEGSLERLSRRAASLGEQFAQVAAERASAETASAELSSSLETMRRSLDELREEAAATHERVESLDESIAGARVDLKERLGRLEVLRDLETSREGVSEGARFLLEEGTDGFALLGDRIDVAPEHARAIERALGTDVEALLAADVPAALDAAELLKRHGKGGAIFWAGEAGTATAPTGDRPAGDGVVGWAPDLIADGARGGAADAVRALLRDVVVVQSRTVALALRERGVTDHWRLVTLDGEVFGPLSRIVAGESVMARGLISRRIEIQRVEAETAALETRIGELETERDTAAGRRLALEERVRQAEARLRDGDLDHAKQTKTVDELKRRETELTEERAVGETESAELRAELETIRAAEAEAEGQLAEVDAELDAIVAEQVELEARATRVRGAASRAKAELDRVDAVLSGLGQRERQRRDVRFQLEERAAETEAARASLQAEAESFREWAAKSVTDVAQVEARIDAAVRAAERWRSLRDQARGEAESFESTLEAAQRDEDEAGTQVEALRRSREDDRVRQGELRTRLESLVERLRSEEGVELAEVAAERTLDGLPIVVALAEAPGATNGEVQDDVHANGESSDGETPEDETPTPTPTEAPTEAPTPRTLTELDEEAARLKRKLDRLGPVNTDAIRELEELEERERFYTRQEHDLVESQRTLEDIIRRINKRSREIFVESFNKIRGEFRNIFRKLFGGGRGDIRLLDEENVLESGVEIVAQPPEKGAKSIDMLSGGERVMTTTALLFAIFTARPCPFCLLDEIDAALDEANIERFLDMVRGFLGTTQFIIVTHSRRTIAEADVIHGITMPKAGKSSRVSVKFENGEIRAEGQATPAFALDA